MHLKFGENIDTDESWCSMTNGCIQSHVTSTIISQKWYKIETWLQYKTNGKLYVVY